ncbi:MAG: precorrin-8X/cobalt-precorrin-8 methylmutase [Frankiales bacterium]|nr:precorrin-8X/cobalt-precorrin-8 methylmutase [Frankiales bacterium]MDX6209454.1 precorrin-8X/cobalt-precorrin-8 methylmutase [Frankiales bacterium]MDX6211419.1 precorrin-8X/cobalt-precorrin-8 methylmutase [Frankiales bacterium]MDX6223418.1 precorrin-8X/cobalt-precorrin-8 methylmutase [Frankiales bacterium]
MTRVVHPIEVQSYAILRSRTDTSSLPPLSRAVVERVIHASADIDYRDDLVCDEDTLARAQAALRGGAAVVCDVAMVAAGITGVGARCWLNDPRTAALAKARQITRSAAGMRLALDAVGPGALWVIGCAPTALFELLAMDAAPALVIGLPVGFVGAAESKAALRGSGLPAVSNRTEKGGSSVAAAALNALLYSGSASEGPS